MAKSVKISEEEMSLLRKEAKISSRSLAGQVEHWLRIGRAIERSPGFNYQRIREALQGLTSPDDLEAEEQEVFFGTLADELWNEPSEQEQTEFAEELGEGNLVGLDDNNRMVHKRQ